MRPQMTAVLAMTADGKIADVRRQPARFGSAADRAHLERQVAYSDAVILGARTLLAHGSAALVHDPALLHMRSERGKSPQTLHIICTRSGEIDRHIDFFHQPVERWLVTSPTGAKPWAVGQEFARIWRDVPWPDLLAEFYALGLRRIGVLGGGSLIAELLAAQVIDDLWLTVCPLIFGGATAPTPVDGVGFFEPITLRLLSYEPWGQEILLHYQVVYGNQAEIL
ncbi:MAG: dihydrofolate reductase family protein [Gloeomargarita sp. DG02_5_bins_242]